MHGDIRSKREIVYMARLVDIIAIPASIRRKGPETNPMESAVCHGKDTANGLPHTNGRAIIGGCDGIALKKYSKNMRRNNHETKGL